MYSTVRKWLYEKGHKHSKKHGNWITLYAPKNQVIIMDTWNGAISQAHTKDTLISNGFSLEGNYSPHTYACPSKFHSGSTKYEQLEEVVDIYKTLLTIK